MRDDKITNHHVICRSRIKRGEHIPNNIVKVTHYEHDKYHQLFRNLTPTEILHYLVTTFWGGDTTFLMRYLEDLED